MPMNNTTFLIVILAIAYIAGGFWATNHWPDRPRGSFVTLVTAPACILILFTAAVLSFVAFPFVAAAHTYRERKFAAAMKDRGRFKGWDEIQRMPDEGTLIIEQAQKDECRVWWTPDHIARGYTASDTERRRVGLPSHCRATSLRAMVLGLRLVFEVVFYGLAYWTGFIALKIFSFGTLNLAPLMTIEERNRRKKTTRQIDGSIWLHRPMRKKALKAEMTCLAGILCWVAVRFGVYFATQETDKAAKVRSQATASRSPAT